jgi:transcriptional regulator with XRE-family HTH domain
MTGKSQNWKAMSDKALAKELGKFIKHYRLLQAKNQEALAKEAAISRSTLSQLERGEPVTISTLIQVLRVLNKLDVFDAFEIPTEISPLAMAKAEKAKRKRVKASNTDLSQPSNW